ncbi:SIMPL domain-containing protein [Halovenus rubra]|uniref:SIMPL domain-containing protein n=1 Tax=Halovenus rubra TaxID=869890 RepID=A0ABD5X8J7_9EURY
MEVTESGRRVQLVQFQIHEAARQQLQDDTLAAATKRAREKAARIAGVEGWTVSELLGATTKEVSTGMDSIVDEALSDHPDTDFIPQPMVISESFEANFKLITE